MRRVNARPRLDEAGVVVVAAGRQDMILSSRTLVLSTDPPRRCAHGFPDVERLNAGSVKVLVNAIKGWIVALLLTVSWTSVNLWAQKTEAELLKQAHVTKHQAKKIALARVKCGTIKSVELEKENGMLSWSIDVAQPGKKNITDVWVDAATGRITAVEVETPAFEKEEVAEHKVQKWLSRYDAN